MASVILNTVAIFNPSLKLDQDVLVLCVAVPVRKTYISLRFTLGKNDIFSFLTFFFFVPSSTARPPPQKKFSVEYRKQKHKHLPCSLSLMHNKCFVLPSTGSGRDRRGHLPLHPQAWLSVLTLAPRIPNGTTKYDNPKVRKISNG